MRIPRLMSTRIISFIWCWKTLLKPTRWRVKHAMKQQTVSFHSESHKKVLYMMFRIKLQYAVISMLWCNYIIFLLYSNELDDCHRRSCDWNVRITHEEVIVYLGKKSIRIVEEDGSSDQRVIAVLCSAVDWVSSLMINNL